MLIESCKPVSSFIPFTDFQNKMDCFTIGKGKKKKNRKEQKNVLVLSAVGLSRGSFFFFLFWMKSGILMGTPSQPRQPLKAPLVRGTRDRRIHCFANLKLSLFPLSFLLDLLVFTLSEYFNPYCGDWCNLSH